MLKKKNFAELIIGAKADLSKVDSDERPALAYAIINNDEPMVDLLVSSGAPVKLGNFRGCRLAYSTLRKMTDPDEKEIMRNIILRLGCRGRSG